MDAWMNGMNAWMNGQMYGYGQMNRQMKEWMNEWMRMRGWMDKGVYERWIRGWMNEKVNDKRVYD